MTRDRCPTVDEVRGAVRGDPDILATWSFEQRHALSALRQWLEDKMATNPRMLDASDEERETAFEEAIVWGFEKYLRERTN